MKGLTLSIGLLIGLFAQTASAGYCEAYLKTRNGRIIESFYGHGYDRQEACRRARRQCNQELRYRQDYGQNPYAYCDVRFGGNGGGYQTVTRYCNSYLVGRYGRHIQTFRGQAFGHRGTGVKRQACNDARRKCNRFRNRQGYYQQQCRTEMDGGPYTPNRPPHGPNRPPHGGF